jgi:hypothetical protein
MVDIGIFELSSLLTQCYGNVTAESCLDRTAGALAKDERVPRSPKRLRF